jgi:hypothetical protein
MSNFQLIEFKEKATPEGVAWLNIPFSEVKPPTEW